MKSSFWRRFCRNKGAVFGLIVLMLVALVTVLGPFIAQNNPWDMVGMPFAHPGAEQGLPLGTDTMGRDIFSGIVAGARVSLLIGVVSTVVSLLIGVSIGAIFAFTRLHGLDDELFRFIVAHGTVELSVMVLSGAAGAAVGEALIRPTTVDRARSFQQAALVTSKVLVACIVLLIGCGFIEGYISPDPQFPMWVRIVVGVGYWFFMMALLRGYLFGRSRGGEPIAA